jgi:hypothetical protein
MDGMTTTNRMYAGMSSLRAHRSTSIPAAVWSLVLCTVHVPTTKAHLGSFDGRWLEEPSP